MSADPRGLPYCRGGLKRTVDILLSGMALLILSPLLAILIVLQLAFNGRPVLYKQLRVGVGGSFFTLIKFRTMRDDASEGSSITARGDRRVTRLGRILRASKLDELPQLLNVLSGTMSIVGPRPELKKYVSLYTDRQRRVLAVRPGLTDPATLRFRAEEGMLAAVDPQAREDFYIHHIMPEKLELNLTYLERASLTFDTLLIARTLCAIVFPPRS